MFDLWSLQSGSGSGEREHVWRESGERERTAVVVTAKSGGGGGWQEGEEDAYNSWWHVVVMVTAKSGSGGGWGGMQWWWWQERWRGWWWQERWRGWTVGKTGWTVGKAGWTVGRAGWTVLSWAVGKLDLCFAEPPLNWKFCPLLTKSRYLMPMHRSKRPCFVTMLVFEKRTDFDCFWWDWAEINKAALTVPLAINEETILERNNGLWLA